MILVPGCWRLRLCAQLFVTMRHVRCCKGRRDRFISVVVGTVRLWRAREVEGASRDGDCPVSFRSEGSETSSPTQLPLLCRRVWGCVLELLLQTPLSLMNSQDMALKPTPHIYKNRLCGYHYQLSWQTTDATEKWCSSLAPVHKPHARGADRTSARTHCCMLISALQGCSACRSILQVEQRLIA